MLYVVSTSTTSWTLLQINSSVYLVLFLVSNHYGPIIPNQHHIQDYFHTLVFFRVKRALPVCSPNSSPNSPCRTGGGPSCHPPVPQRPTSGPILSGSTLRWSTAPHPDGPDPLDEIVTRRYANGVFWAIVGDVRVMESIDPSCLLTFAWRGGNTCVQKNTESWKKFA